MPVHPQAQRLLDRSADDAPLGTLSAAEHRADQRVDPEVAGPPAPVADVRDLTLPGPAGPVPVRVHRPSGDEGLPAVVLLHGGGWVLGTVEGSDGLARDLAVGVGAVVVTPDYRLAPEHPFPAAVDDAVAVTTALLEGTAGLGTDPARVAVIGDSAGGNLAAVVAQQLRHRAPALRHQVLVYPITDVRPGTLGSTGSYRRYGEGHGLTTEGMTWFADVYAGSADGAGSVDRGDPRLSPLAQRDLAGLPPATVVLAECDVLADEGESYAAAMADAGVEVLVRCFEGQVHGFFSAPGVVDDARTARALVAERLRACFG